MSNDKLRQDDQPAFVLHTYPYLETSLLVETFTRNFGRVPLVAKAPSDLNPPSGAYCGRSSRCCSAGGVSPN